MYKEYRDVPWYRRSGLVGAITFLGLVFSPAILFSCFVVLTGDVYKPKKDQTGNLTTWSYGNKIAAVIILLIHVALYAAILSGKISLPNS
jgi:hypothetical protein